MFQSHAGSIEARRCTSFRFSIAGRFNPTLVRLRPPNSNSNRIARSMCFNPTLVRLRPGHSMEDGLKLLRGFNPTLVRLRRGTTFPTFPRHTRFQSHAGSIEAPRFSLPHRRRPCGFNPTLVRLRPCQVGVWCSLGKLCFNPTLVRLRRRAQDFLQCDDFGFNPTLVRLRRLSMVLIPDNDEGFNPTLVRLRPFVVVKMTEMGAGVSIPRWFD